MTQSFENVSVNGCEVQTESEWTPYNPFTLVLPSDCLQLRVRDSFEHWYHHHVIGYTGINTRDYVSMDATRLRTKLDQLLCVTDELTLLHWVFQLARHHGAEENQQVFQMPEDFYREFIADQPKAVIHQSAYLNLNDSCPESDLVWVSSKFIVNSIHQYPDGTNQLKPKKIVPIYNLKLITAYLLSQFPKDQDGLIEVDYSKLCEVYTHFHRQLWEQIAVTASLDDQDFIFCGHGWLEDGQEYTVVSKFAEMNILKSQPSTFLSNC